MARPAWPPPITSTQYDRPEKINYAKMEKAARA